MSLVFYGQAVDYPVDLFLLFLILHAGFHVEEC